MGGTASLAMGDAGYIFVILVLCTLLYFIWRSRENMHRRWWIEMERRQSAEVSVTIMEMQMRTMAREAGIPNTPGDRAAEIWQDPGPPVRDIDIEAVKPVSPTRALTKDR